MKQKLCFATLGLIMVFATHVRASEVIVQPDSYTSAAPALSWDAGDEPSCPPGANCHPSGEENIVKIIPQCFGVNARSVDHPMSGYQAGETWIKYRLRERDGAKREFRWAIPFEAFHVIPSKDPLARRARKMGPRDVIPKVLKGLHEAAASEREKFLSPGLTVEASLNLAEVKGLPADLLQKAFELKLFVRTPRGRLRTPADFKQSLDFKSSR